ncbi:MAG: chorismate-binding protein [Oligoflexia bacterium]|nr:chorismate-binding protein [Oligoflexia bacterium]
MNKFKQYLILLLQSQLNCKKVNYASNSYFKTLNYKDCEADFLLTLDDISKLLVCEIYPKFLLKERDSICFHLTLGKVIDFEFKNDKEKIKNLLSLNENFKLWGAVAFEDNLSESINERRFFLPFIEIKLEKIYGKELSFKPQEIIINSYEMPDDKTSQEVLEIKVKRDIKDFLIFLNDITTKEIHFDKNEDSWSNFKSKETIPSKEKWKQEIEDFKTLNERDHDFKKIVLAKRICFENTSNNFYYHQQIIYEILKDHFSHNSLEKSYIIFWNLNKDLSFVSISPERLFLLKNKTIYTEAIAGTITSERVLASAKTAFIGNIKFSRKDIEEHNLVILRLEEVLDKILGKNRWKRVKYLENLCLNNLQHLYTTFAGNLSEEQSENSLIIINELLYEMHPTPAVCGYPKDKALEFILKKTLFQRDLYASAIGYLSSSSAEFVVGIRSALLEKDQIYMYAGAGIVKDSNVDSEWDELDLKISSIKQFVFRRVLIDHS